MIDATVSEFSYEEYKSLDEILDFEDMSEDLKKRSINVTILMMECAL